MSDITEGEKRYAVMVRSALLRQVKSLEAQKAAALTQAQAAADQRAAVLEEVAAIEQRYGLGKHAQAVEVDKRPVLLNSA